MLKVSDAPSVSPCGGRGGGGLSIGLFFTHWKLLITAFNTDIYFKTHTQIYNKELSTRPATRPSEVK